MKKIILILLLVTGFTAGYAQDEQKKTKKELRRERISEISKQEEEGVIKYKKHFTFGGKLTTDGYGAFLEVGKAQSVNKGLLFQFEFAERKHTKEEKQQLNYSSSFPHIYGKINYFYPLKLGVQQQLVLGNKGNKNGVSVTGNIGGGLIIGLLRPYMINVERNGKIEYISYYDDSTDFLNQGTYLRGPSLGTGWNQMKVTPGIYIKPAFRFDYGKYNEMVNAIEVGITAEFFSKKVEQMVFQENKQFFISGFVAIVLGRRK